MNEKKKNVFKIKYTLRISREIKKIKGNLKMLRILN